MARLLASVALLSGWLDLLLLGHAGHGAVHLLLVAALLLFPWRLLRSGEAAAPTEPVPPASGAPGPPP